MSSSNVVNDDISDSKSTTYQHSVTPIFQDMTDVFFSAVKDLSMGELVHHSSFSLEDSISALEMMDPKMDSGLREDEPTWDVNRELNPYKILGLMDKIFAAESGYFLSQTLFANVFIQKLLECQETININDFYLENRKSQSVYKDLMNAVLWPFMICSVKICGILSEMFNKNILYEEEEVSSNSFGLSLLEHIDTIHALKLLEFSIYWLDNHSNKFQKKDQEYLKAILLRLKIRVAFLHALSSSSEIDAINNLEYIVNIINKDISIFDFGDEIDVFFSTSIQAKLSTTMPPRPIVIFPIDVAFNNFEDICRDFRKILLLSIEKISFLTPLNILNFFRYFRTKKPNPSPFIRIMLQSLFFSNNMILNKFSLDQFIIDSISEIYSPAKKLFTILNQLCETYNDSKHCIFNSVNNFIKTASIVYVNVFRIMCHNPSRQRRNFCKLVLDLESLQTEAENIDIQLQSYFLKELNETFNYFLFPYIFSSWCFYEKLQIMILICFLGFELELHSSHELSLIYWYLDYLLKTFLENETSTIYFSEKANITTSTNQQIKFDQDWNNGLQLMCNAFYKFFLVLKQFSFIRSPNRLQIPKSFMYKQRFKTFLSLKTPKFLDYEIFIKESDISNMSILHLLEDILEKFLKAKTLFEIIKKSDPKVSNTILCHDAFQEDIKNIIQSCTENELVCKLMIQKVSENIDLYEETFININYKYHSWFPVISMTLKS
ncbi:hypothetical protein PMAC_002901 [Pneumocystis sp. 'macacae']|nr:hypothetical protein PMAC_002901 [Pneumocystis sp. 'macacae']